MALVTFSGSVYLFIMSTVKEIKEAISHFSPEEYKTFRTWFEEYESHQWDSQFEKDVKAGRMDSIAVCSHSSSSSTDENI